MLSRLDLESKGQGHSKNRKPMPWGTKNMPPKKNLSRGSLSNWCDVDADADADISKTICRPPPYRGVDIIISNHSPQDGINPSLSRSDTCNVGWI